VAQGYAQDISNIANDLDLSGRNPFKSWLPKIEENIVKPLEGDTIENKDDQSGIAAQKAAEIQPPDLKLNGLVWNTTKPQAIINDQVVNIGDIIENSKIVDIKKDGVDIIFSEKLFTIPIEQPSTQSS
jgi:hypothetical protein